MMDDDTNKNSAHDVLADVLTGMDDTSSRRALAMMDRADPAWREHVAASWDSGVFGAPEVFRDVMDARSTLADAMASAFARRYGREATDGLILLARRASMMESWLRSYFVDVESYPASTDKTRFVMRGVMLMSIGLNPAPMDHGAWYQPDAGDWATWYDLVFAQARAPQDYGSMIHAEQVRADMDALRDGRSSESI